MSDINIGGQAVIEGLMLRGKNNWVLGLRSPENEIVVEAMPLKFISKKHSFLKLPIIRGSIALVEALILGMKALTLSAKFASSEEEEELKGWHMVLAIVIAMSLAVGLFIITPAFLAKTMYKYIDSPVLINLFEGILKITILTIYIWSISRLKDIARVYEYHGAEHAVIHAFENNETLEPSLELSKHTRHMRCGTSFLLLVMITSILIFSFLGKPPLVERILYHLAIVPIIAGISYEIIRFAGKHSKNKLVQVLMSPGLMLQYMTTRQPSIDQLEVAMAALKELLRVEGIIDNNVKETIRNRE